ncbi:MAG: PAS domain S-box protein [Bacteroidia bacterium]|nr:PAS domain S-box protein [Bacteroidia bacterium]
MVLPVPKTEAFFNALIENSQDAISLTDSNFNVVYRSPSAVRITGFTDEDRAISGGKELTHPDDVERMRKVMVEVLSNPGKQIPCKFRTMHKDGHYIWMEGSFTNKLSDPAIRGIISNLKDVTERIISHEELQKTIRELTDYKYSLDESSIVAITDQKGTIKHANENFCRISKFSREELIGNDHRLINSGYHTKEFIRDLWVTIANGKIWRGDIKNRAKDGTTYWVETTIVPFLNDNGKPYQYVAIRADITQRKETEEQLANNLLELERSNKDLEQFAYIASHDLQEPLRMVGSYMQLIEKRYKGKLDNDADDFIHFAIDGASRMKQLIADLLNYSRLNRESTLTTVNLNSLLTSVLHNLSSVIKEKDALVYIEDLPDINADETQMIQLFQNLLSNALKFTESDTKPIVKVSCERLDHHWLFAIADNGIGIEHQYAERIFVVFKQLHTKAKYSGTGIGLAIAKKIVERHGGRIWFNSEQGKGSVFYFTIKS